MFSCEWIRGVISVEPFVFVMNLASNLNYPVLQGLVFNRICQTHFNLSSCNSTELSKAEQNAIETETSHWLLILNIAFYLPQLVTVILLGSLSDVYGRQPFLSIPPIFCLFATGVYLSEALFAELPLWLLVIGNFLQGAGGGYICSFMLGYGYVSDCTSHKSRTKRLSVCEGFSYLGTLVGLFLGGWIVDNFGYYVVWCVNIALYCLITIYVLLWIRPISMHVEHIPSDNFLHLASSPLCCCPHALHAKFLHGFRLCLRGSEKLKYRFSLLGLVAILGLLTLSGIGEGVISYLYLTSYPFNLNQAEFGYFIGTKTLTSAIGTIFLLPLLTKHLHLLDLTCAIIGMIFRIATEFYFSACFTIQMIYLIPILALPSNFVAPACRSFISKNVAKNEIGAIFSIIAFLEALVGLLGGTAFSALYPVSLDWWPGFSFFLIGVILSCGLLMLLVMRYLFGSRRLEILVASEDRLVSSASESHRNLLN